jgi:3-hydroxymyristoyl/3-hydroxydecanoyl-(acyl carrier protein) dehydratase
MDHRYRAFSFVDRISVLEPGVRVSGSWRIPSSLPGFPLSLVAEATGQLAAWSAMAAIDFSHRPVAGIAGRVELLGEAFPGQTLELSAELETADQEAVAYGGVASVDGQPILRLHHCVGPMMPAEEFDDPAAMRERLALLCGPGAEPGAFRAVPEFTLDDLAVEAGSVARAKLQVPAEAAFFGDHFPRRPVFPGTLLMNMNLKLIDALAQSVAVEGGAWVARAVADMKLRSFIAPGTALDLEAKVLEHSGDQLLVSVQTKAGGRLQGAARVELAPATAK